MDSDDTDESGSSRGRKRKGKQNLVRWNHGGDFKTMRDGAQSDHTYQWSDGNPFKPLEDEKDSLQPSEHWYTNTKMKYSDTKESLTDDSTELKPRKHAVKRSGQVKSLGEGPEVEVQISFRVHAPKAMRLIRGGRWAVKSRSLLLGTKSVITEFCIHGEKEKNL